MDSDLLNQPLDSKKINHELLSEVFEFIMNCNGQLFLGRECVQSSENLPLSGSNF